MKTKKTLLLLVAWIGCMAFPVFASGLGDIRVNARFLTDRMAFELNLGTRQYHDLYEVNYDFLRNIDGYVDALARRNARAVEMYYHYLDARNDDVRWILSKVSYNRFMNIDYFFRPVFAINRVCRLRIYSVYTDCHHYHYQPPRHYHTYCGEHDRRHWKGGSYYEHHASKEFRRTMYKGHTQCRKEIHQHDFHPIQVSHPGIGHRPEPPRRPAMNPRPSSSHRPEANGRPGTAVSRPSSRREDKKHKEVRTPSKEEHGRVNRPSRGKKQETVQPERRSRNDRRGEDGQRRLVREL